MKIGITGTHGSGKTSIINLIPEWFISRIEEGARDLIEKTGINPLVGNSTYEEKKAFEYHVLGRQISDELSRECFVSDRTIFDVIAYSRFLLTPKDYVEIRSRAMSHYRANPYDLVVLSPADFPMPGDDGVRPQEGKFRMDVENEIKKVLAEEKIPYLTVVGTDEDRAWQVMSLVNHY